MSHASGLLAALVLSVAFASDAFATKNSGSKGYNYRDSGSGRYVKKDAAQRRPPATVEKERRRSK